MKTTSIPVAFLICLGATAAMNANAQLADLLRGLTGGASSPATGSSARGAANDQGLMPVKPNANVANELAPDRLCKQVEEKTDVWQKLMEYGGLEAQLRMQRLLSSDFQFSDLTPEDRAMLRYIAYTTIWVPPIVESGLGRLYAKYLNGSSQDETRNRLERSQMQRQNEQLQAFRAVTDNFPGDMKLVLGNESTGASARPGGLIVLSRDFLNRMDESPAIQHLVLAHEMSHLYKRHTIKELQYRLITNSAGFNLAKQLLKRYDPASSGNLFSMARDAVTTVTLANELFEFIKNHQVLYQTNQELEADACSVEWMKRRSLDVGELWQAFAELDNVLPGDESSYLRTHPTTEERQQNIQAAARVKVDAADRTQPHAKKR